MPIEFKQLGEHPMVLCAEFGTGDIQIVKTRNSVDEPMNAVLLRQDEKARPIGELSDEFLGKTSDEVPNSMCLIRFSNTESLDVMIESLQELKQSMQPSTPPATQGEDINLIHTITFESIKEYRQFIKWRFINSHPKKEEEEDGNKLLVEFITNTYGILITEQEAEKVLNLLTMTEDICKEDKGE